MTSLEELDIFELYDQLKQTNKEISCWIQNYSELEFPKKFEEAQNLIKLISNKPRLVRENWFSEQTYSLCKALREEDYRTADIVITDIKYFTRCFLQDSDFGRDTRTETLKLIADTIS